MTTTTGIPQYHQRPGSTESGAINLSTGDLAFPVSLVSLPGRNGLTYDLSIEYSSASVPTAVSIWNAEAPTGPLGLGWTFRSEKIVRDTQETGTTADDTYYFSSGGSLSPLLYTGTDPEGEIYVIGASPFWKIRYQPTYELWIVIKEDGTRFHYGGNQQSPTGGGQAVELAVTWGNWIGPSISGGQQNLAVVWNLAAIQHPFGDQIRLLYEQTQHTIGPDGNDHCKYTVACRLKQVKGATGELVNFTYAEKGPNEYLREYSAAGPEAYQDRLDTTYLEFLEVRSVDDKLITHITFGFQLLGAGLMQKRLLTSITHFAGENDPYAPAHVFTYYGMKTSKNPTGDDVSVTRSVYSHLFVADTGALYGALKSHTLPEGATSTYRYSKLNIETAQRDLVILPPQIDLHRWDNPQTHFGPDYVVIIWIGFQQMFVSVYQWSGRWLEAKLGGFSIPHSTLPQVELGTTFFAVLTPSLNPSVHLFSKDQQTPGKWLHHSPSLGELKQYQTALGSKYYVILDQASGSLHRFVLKGTAWQADKVQLQAASQETTVFGLAGQNNMLFAVSADSANKFPPQPSLYWLDRMMTWNTRPWPGPVLPYCPTAEKKSVPYFEESGIQRLVVHISDTFVALQSCHHTEGIDAGEGNRSSSDHYRHFVYRWNETYQVIEQRELGSEILVDTEVEKGDSRLTVVGSQIHVDTVTKGQAGPEVKSTKQVYQFDGTDWHVASFDTDHLHHNYFGFNSFSVTKNGNAQYHQWNPGLVKWEAPSTLPAYQDSNPTWLQKWWPVISFAEGLLTLPLGLEGLLIDVLFFSLDQVISSFVAPGTAGQQSGRFFIGDNIVYYRNPDATWTEIGKFATTHESRIEGNTVHKVDQSLSYQSIQTVSTFVTFGIEENRYTSMVVGGVLTDIPDPGFEKGPKSSSRVQIFKNGQFFGPAIDLPEGESLKRSTSPYETELMGPEAFLTYSGGSILAGATSLHLYRVIQDHIQGTLETYVVSREELNDGYASSSTHYEYETAEMHPSGETAFFNKVTTIYSGASAVSDKTNGYLETYFYTGGTAALPYAPTTAPGNVWDYPLRATGLRYHSRTYAWKEGTPTLLGSTTEWWQFFVLPLVRQEQGFYARWVKQEAVIDSFTRVTETEYDAAGHGFPTKSTFTNVTLSGAPEQIITTYQYACQDYPELARQNILSTVSQLSRFVNGMPTESTATLWQQFAPAAPGQAGLSYPKWAPSTIYHARSASPASSPPAAKDSTGWLKTAEVTVRHAETGVVTELENIDGVVRSTIYDERFRFPIASFTHANVHQGEAGYYGFEAYEDAAPWEVTGTVETRQLGSHRAVLSGKTATVRPKRFQPHAGDVPYLVSAWVRPRLGGAGASLGFGQRSWPVPLPEQGTEWRYVEHVVSSTTPEEKPFVTCDGDIDDVRFGPVDAPFSASIYHPSYHYMTARLGTNGETSQYEYSAQHEVYAELGTGAHLQGLQWHTYSRRSTDPWQPLTPNRTLTIAARGGSQCLPAQGDLRGNFLLLDATLTEQSGWGIYLPMVVQNWEHNNLPGSPPLLEIGNIQVRLTDDGYVLTDGTDHSYPAPAGARRADWKAGPTPVKWEWMVLAIGERLLFWVNQQLVFCQQASAIRGQVTLKPLGPGNGTAYSVEEVLTWRDPLVSLVYRDGLGREIQTQHLDDQAAGEIMTQTLYDGWGHPAVQTLPLKRPKVTMCYDPEVVTAFDWTSGVMAGAVVDFYTRVGQSDDLAQIIELLPEDPRFAYRRQLAEANPLARIIERGGPGSAQRVGGGQTIRTNYGLTPEAQTLFSDLNLTPQNYSATTTYLPHEGGLVPVVRILDRQGNQIARRWGVGVQGQTVGVESSREVEGLTMTTFPPGAYAMSALRGQYASRDDFDYAGNLTHHRDADTGECQLVYDRTGRLRFRQDASGASASPPQIQYWKYDPLGRLIETGLLHCPWNRAELQAYADSQPTWPWDRTSAWPMSGGNPRRNGLASVRGAVAGTPSWHYSFPDVPYAPSVDVAGNVYLASYNHVYALSANGTLKWTYPVEHSFYQVTPAIGDDGTIYVGTSGEFLALTPEEGKLKWKLAHPTWFVWSPVVGEDGTIYVSATADGRYSGTVCAISPKQPKLLWESPSRGRVCGPPAVGPNGRIYAAHVSGDSWVVALDSSGALQWHYPPSPLPPPDSIYEGTSPVVGADGTVYLSLLERTLLALKPDGTEYWKFKEQGGGWGRCYPPAIGPKGILYWGMEGGQVLAVTPEGSRLWMFQTGNAILAAPTIGADGAIYIPSSDRFLYALTPEGQLKWKVATNGENVCSPAIGADGTLYVCNGGSTMTSATLFTFGTATLPSYQWTTRWRYDADRAGESTNRKGRLSEVITQATDTTIASKVGDRIIESYQYDLDGNTTAVTLQVEAFDATPRTVSYRYNPAGQVVEVLYPPATVGAEQPAPDAPSGALTSVCYRYDTLGRLVGIGTAKEPDRFAAYLYGFNGALRAEWLNKRTVVGPHEYDLQGNLLRIDYRTAAAPLFTEALRYTDANGRSTGGLVAQEVTHMAQRTPYAYQYRYDSLGRLSTARTLALPEQGIKARPEWDVTGPGGAPIPYDANGNIQSLQMVTRTHAFAYAAGSNRLETRTTAGHSAEPFPHTPNGEVKAGLYVHQIDYDPVQGLPVKADFQGRAPVSFQYRGDGPRVLKTQGTSPQEQVSRLYIHGASAYPLAELTNQQQVRFNIYGPGGLVAIWADGKPTFVVKDHLGSTRVLLDEAGKVLGSYNYLPFGVLMPDNSSSVRPELCCYLYTGQEYDPETGLYNYRARWYAPFLGRFLAPDPQRQVASPYLYVNNNPINFIDPTGEVWEFFRSILGLAKTEISAVPKVARIAPLVIRDVKDLRILHKLERDLSKKGRSLIFHGNRNPGIAAATKAPLEEITKEQDIITHMHSGEPLKGVTSFTRSRRVARTYSTTPAGSGKIYGVIDPQQLSDVERMMMWKRVKNLQQEIPVRNFHMGHVEVIIEGPAREMFGTDKEKELIKAFDSKQWDE